MCAGPDGQHRVGESLLGSGRAGTVNVSSIIHAQTLDDHASLPLCSYDEPFPPMQIVTRIYVALPIIIVGMLTNSLNVIIYCSKYLRQSAVNRCLLFLSASDLLLLTCSLCFLPMPVIAELSDSVDFMQFVGRVMFWMYPTSQLAATWSVYFTVTVSLYQCILLRHRYFATKYITPAMIDMFLIGILLFGYLFNVNRYFELQVRPCHSKKYHSPSSSTPIVHLVPSPLSHSGDYYLIYHVYLTAIVLLILPVCVLIPVNLAIIRFLQPLKTNNNNNNTNKKQLTTTTTMANGTATSNGQQNLQRRKSLHVRLMANARTKIIRAKTIRKRDPTNANQMIEEQRRDMQQDRDTGVTIMLLGVVGVFLTCNLLTFSNNIVQILAQHSLNAQQFMSSSSYTLLVEVGNLLVLLNSATTFFIYITFNVKFRAGFVEMLLSWLNTLLCCCGKSNETEIVDV